MTKVKGDYDNVVKENMKMTEENKNYNINLDAKQKELNQEVKANEKLKARIKELEEQ